MFVKQLERFTDVLIEKGISKSEEKDIITHGLATGIELIFNIITTIVLGFLFGLIIESLIFLISFSFIRTYAGGYHCTKSINCYLMSSSIVAIVLSVVKFTHSGYVFFISLIILCVSVPLLLILAPTETHCKPLDELEIIYYRKKLLLNLTAEFILITMMFLIGWHYYAYVICLGITVSSSLIFLQRYYIIHSVSKIRKERNN